MAQSKRATSTADDRYTKTTWRGRPIFRCGSCPASRTSEDAIQRHVDNAHPAAPRRGRSVEHREAVVDVAETGAADELTDAVKEGGEA